MSLSQRFESVIKQAQGGESCQSDDISEGLRQVASHLTMEVVGKIPNLCSRLSP